MFTRSETSRIRQEFWTTFGRYMTPVPSAEGTHINWINYHTHVKDVHFRMETGTNSASVFISLEQTDPGIRDVYFEQFLELKTMLHDFVGEEWEWKRLVTTDSGRRVSRISRSIPGVSVLNKDHWPELISFFKPRIIALDSFWENARYSFEDLK